MCGGEHDVNGAMVWGGGDEHDVNGAVVCGVGVGGDEHDVNGAVVCVQTSLTPARGT